MAIPTITTPQIINKQTDLTLPIERPKSPTEVLADKIQEKTHPIIRVLVFLAGLAMFTASIAFVAVCLVQPTPLIGLALLLFPVFTSVGSIYMYLAIEGNIPSSEPLQVESESDRNDMIDMTYSYMRPIH